MAGQQARDDIVDVIVPVYRGLARTLECLHSLIATRPEHRTRYEIIVLDDASPEPELVAALTALAARGQIQLRHHPVNLGFVRGMNRALVEHPVRDVVWLNADTRVQGDWLDRLRAAAYSAPDVASVTPLSNCGELMSFPQPGARLPLPSPALHAQLDRLARRAWSGDWPELVVGCGFCLYVRRAALARVGLLDESAFGAGYGEDTDWCLRAHEQGLRHLGAPNLFVAHEGSVSFGLEKSALVARHNALLRQRYPHVERCYGQHLARDPVQPHRQRLQRTRLEWVRGARPLHLIGAWHWQDPRLPLHPPHRAPDAPPLPGRRWLAWRTVSTGLEVTLTLVEDEAPIVLNYRLPDAQAELAADLARIPHERLVWHLSPARCPLSLRMSLAQWTSRHTLDIPLPSAAPMTTTDKTTSDPFAMTGAILIADPLDRPECGQRWCALARRLARADRDVALIFFSDRPWANRLIATGMLVPLSVPPGIDLLTTLRLSGCRLALSLEPTPDEHWSAPDLAARLGLPLWAPPSPRAQARGAYVLPANLSFLWINANRE